MADSGTPGIWVDLDWLLGLPLEGPALSTLWAAVRAQLAVDAQPSPGAEQVQAALEEALARQELFTVRQICLGGDWFEGLRRLEGLLEDATIPLGAAELPAQVLAELMLELHQHLIDHDASACSFDEEQRADLLWWAHRFLGRLQPMPGPRPSRLPVVIEQISRYGALAWMERDGRQARRRAVELLVRMCTVNPEAHPWGLPAIRERLSAEVQEQASSGEPASHEGLELLLRWCEALGDLDPPGTPSQEVLRQALLRGRLSLDLLRGGGD